MGLCRPYCLGYLRYVGMVDRGCLPFIQSRLFEITNCTTGVKALV